MNLIKPNQLDRSRPGTWPIIYQILVWLAITVLVFFLYSRFVRQDLIEEQQQYSSQISTLEGEYKELYQFSLDLPLYLEQKQKLSRKLVSLLTYLPSKADVPELIDKVYNAASKSNINFSQVSPQDTVKKEYYDVEPISLTASTGFNNFASFVQYIGELPRILNVRAFSLNVDDKIEDTLSVSGKLETYIYNQDISKYVLIGENKDEK